MLTTASNGQILGHIRAQGNIDYGQCSAISHTSNSGCVCVQGVRATLVSGVYTTDRPTVCSVSISTRGVYSLLTG